MEWGTMHEKTSEKSMNKYNILAPLSTPKGGAITLGVGAAPPASRDPNNKPHIGICKAPKTPCIKRSVVAEYRNMGPAKTPHIREIFDHEQGDI